MRLHKSLTEFSLILKCILTLCDGTHNDEYLLLFFMRMLSSHAYWCCFRQSSVTTSGWCQRIRGWRRERQPCWSACRPGGTRSPSCPGRRMACPLTQPLNTGRYPHLPTTHTSHYPYSIIHIIVSMPNVILVCQSSER